MKEEIARQAVKMLDAIAAEEKRLEEITKMKEDALFDCRTINYLHMIKNHEEMFLPTLKDYVIDVLDKAIDEKKELIDMAKLALDQL